MQHVEPHLKLKSIKLQAHVECKVKYVHVNQIASMFNLALISQSSCSFISLQ